MVGPMLTHLDRCWIRQLPADHIYMQEEILGIDTAIELQRSSVGLGFWQPFKALANNRRVLYRFILGGLLFLFQNASGINAIVSISLPCHGTY